MELVRPETLILAPAATNGTPIPVLAFNNRNHKLKTKRTTCNALVRLCQSLCTTIPTFKVVMNGRKKLTTVCRVARHSRNGHVFHGNKLMRD